MFTFANLSHKIAERDKRYLSKFQILLGLELILLVYCICQYAYPLHQYTYEDHDLVGSYCSYGAYSDDYASGCYLDESLIPEEVTNPEYLYISTPYVDLPKGSYQVSIVYKTDRDGNYSANSKYRIYSVTAGREPAMLSYEQNKEIFSFFLILFLTLYTSAPILSFFMPAGDDLPFHLNRIEAIKNSLLTGQFPNRVSFFWNNGYGYAAAVFYGMDCNR